MMTKVDIRDLHPCRRELTIEIPLEAMEEEMGSVYARLSRGRRIPGFRPGKAPRKILEKYFRDEARSETVGNRVRRGYLDAVREQEIEVFGDPDFSEIDWPEAGPLRFKVAVDVRPMVELKNYRGIRLTGTDCRVEDTEVDRTLEGLRERSATFETINGRPLREGDWALVDYRPSGHADENWVEGTLVEITSPDHEGIGSQLAGMPAGESRSVTIPPAGDQNADAAPLEVEIRLREIKKRNLPEASDEWARTWGQFSGLEELRGQIREDIRQRKELEQKRSLEEQAIEYLLKKHTFPLPPATLDSLIEEYRKEVKEQADRALSAGREKVPEEKIAEIARQRAEADLRLIFILSAIARAENLEVDARLLGEEVALLARQKGVSPVEYRRELEESGRLGVVRDRLLRRLATDFIIKEAKIK